MITETELETLRFPIGKFVAPAVYTEALLQERKESIRDLPIQLRAEVSQLNEEQLNTPYRPEGWTTKQVVHHLADSHMNGFTRLKLALCEDKPTIKPYPEALFAEMSDYKMSVDISLSLLEAIHSRWFNILLSLKETDLERSYIHPQYGKEVSIKQFICSYAWHGEHHLAHITGLKKRMGWL